MLFPGNFVLDVQANSGDRGSNSCPGLLQGREFCGTLDPRNGESYDVSIFPRVDGVTPPRGGSYGGNLISISGAMFQEDCANVAVLIGGSPCECVSSTYSEIICRAGDQSTSATRLGDQSLARGLRFEGYDYDGNILRERRAVTSFIEAFYSQMDRTTNLFTGCFRISPMY